LDVGTGCGLLAAALVGIRAFVTSIDIDFETVVQARDRLTSKSAGIAGRSRLLVADVSRLPFPSDIFDAVFCFDSMHHMTD
jgi:ubiquinone/menaquinone biosynthesis C-methylase UbiE